MRTRFIALTAKQRAKGFFNEARKTGKLTALVENSMHSLSSRKNANRGAAVEKAPPHFINEGKEKGSALISIFRARA